MRDLFGDERYIVLRAPGHWTIGGEFLQQFKAFKDSVIQEN